MYRILILMLGLFYFGLSFAKGSYQVDLILFAHPQNPASVIHSNTPLLPVNKNAIQLTTSSNGYRLLPVSKSGLRNENYRLRTKSPYQILGDFSWIQPVINRDAVALPAINQKGWQMQGTVQIRKFNYYVINTDLHFSAPNNPLESFTVTQKHRLKENTVYYIDHPQIGILIKIHRLP